MSEIIIFDKLQVYYIIKEAINYMPTYIIDLCKFEQVNISNSLIIQKDTERYFA